MARTDYRTCLHATWSDPEGSSHSGNIVCRGVAGGVASITLLLVLPLLFQPPLSSFQPSAGILLRSLMWSACWPSRMTGHRSSSSMLRIGRSPAGSARISTRDWSPRKADVRSVLAEGFAQQPSERIPGQMPLRVLVPEQQVIHGRQFFESVRGQLTGLLIARQNSLRR